MSSEEAFAAWAPDGVVWSPWAKPIAFVQADVLLAADALAAQPARVSLPEEVDAKLDAGSVVIVDLPGAEAVQAGLALADRGFRPIPLFNGTSGPSPVIDVVPITAALVNGAASLTRSSSALPADAPPAFLLDARRSGAGSPRPPGAYDNRWVALPQDFPSGSLLASHGIRRATLLQRGSVAVAADLAHVLLRWQESGLTVGVIELTSGRSERNVVIPKPSGFRRAWYSASALLGLRRSDVGGFGSTIPDDPEHGGSLG
jgi:hypothetical protein